MLRRGSAVGDYDWRSEVLELLQDLANSRAQKRAWVDREGASFFSPVELVCRLYDDTALGDYLEKGSAFGGDCDRLLRELGDLVGSVNLDQSPEELLADAQWLEAQRLAERVIPLVRAALGDRTNDPD
ncbi:hypothetical protein ABI59_17635 [Acidobacteria bacterium Mor1]|nr:hypothetical protein ABI59_17635 [Acidobacteria bacterium Mor1]